MILHFMLFFGTLASDFHALETGDLVFLDLQCGSLCESIEQVTLNQLQSNGPRLSHLGVVIKGTQMEVLDAWPAGGVQKTLLPVFLKRAPEQSPLWIARIRPEFRDLSVRATQWIEQQRGAPYDSEFFVNDRKFYCSELVYEAWKNTALEANPLRLRPMYFGSPTSSEYRVWSDYFAKMQLPVLTGWPGISPLGVFLDIQAVADVERLR
jgi:hypothetical protein